MEMREPLRNIIVHVLHDCRDGGIFSRGQDKGNIHAFFSPFVENGNCFKRVVGVIERFMVGPSKPPLQASMNRKTVSTPHQAQKVRDTKYYVDTNSSSIKQ